MAGDRGEKPVTPSTSVRPWEQFGSEAGKFSSQDDEVPPVLHATHLVVGGKVLAMEFVLWHLRLTRWGALTCRIRRKA